MPVLQRFLAKNIGTFTKMRRPVTGKFFSMGVRLRNAMWRYRLQMLCPRNSTLVQARLVAKFGLGNAGSAPNDWGTLLFQTKGDLPLPVHTLMICCLPGVTLKRTFDPKWSAADYGNHHYRCFPRKADPRRRFIAAYQRLHRCSLASGNPHACQDCRTNLKGVRLQ